MKTKSKQLIKRKNYILNVDAMLLYAMAATPGTSGAALISRVTWVAKVPNSTAYANLGKLVEAKLVSKKGTGKGSTYQITAAGKKTVQETSSLLLELNKLVGATTKIKWAKGLKPGLPA